MAVVVMVMVVVVTVLKGCGNGDKYSNQSN